ncbi:MAG: hypothetical protein IT436_17730 [Phycisphaerales bacterium]|nr:hypothetical protein [Phycisphaerales bacterium]
MRTTLHAIAVCILLAAGGSATAVFSAEPPPATTPESRSDREVNLRPKFRKGDQTRFIMTIDSTGQTRSADAAAPASKDRSRPDSKKPAKQAAADDKAEEQTMKQELGLLLRVKEADPEKGATIELVYESLKVDLRSPGMDVTFDSTKKAAKPASKTGSDPSASMPTEQDMIEAMLRPMVGTTITMQVDADGNITSSSGGSALSMAGMLTAVNGLTGSSLPGAGAGGDALGSLFTVAKGRGSAAVGESWTTSDTLDNSLIGTFRITNKTTLKSHARGLAQLAFAGHLEPGTQGSPGLLSSTAQVKESDFTGDAAWDTERGMLKTMTSDQRIVMDATVPDMDAGQRSVTMTSRTRVTVKRID